MSRLGEDLQALNDNRSETLQALWDTNSDCFNRTAIVRVSDYLAVNTPNLSLDDIMAHPDMPEDAIPLYPLAVVDNSRQFVIASKRFGAVSEGQTPPPFILLWGDDGSGFKGVETGARPKYSHSICPYCGA